MRPTDTSEKGIETLPAFRGQMLTSSARGGSFGSEASRSLANCCAHRASTSKSRSAECATAIGVPQATRSAEVVRSSLNTLRSIRSPSTRRTKRSPPTLSSSLTLHRVRGINFRSIAAIVPITSWAASTVDRLGTKNGYSCNVSDSECRDLLRCLASSRVAVRFVTSANAFELRLQLPLERSEHIEHSIGRLERAIRLGVRADRLEAVVASSCWRSRHCRKLAPELIRYGNLAARATTRRDR